MRKKKAKECLDAATCHDCQPTLHFYTHILQFYLVPQWKGNWGEIDKSIGRQIDEKNARKLKEAKQKDVIFRELHQMCSGSLL